ncbi:hypothetical protein BXZ70DRAFT_1011185 [Cristinia sonorae]|uniref:Uncharacterized protein n=1 Tax=Cristinia sonorae TaxID=1940300 RepID=A0A8K0UI18_9AGAR|nr:hypothetical protein BXZ70DRAFT_1011185 [Cristinia sonorae]
MRFSTFSAFVLASVPLALSASVISENALSLCEAPTVVEETFIGENKNVQVQALKCANDVALEKRQGPPPSGNVCGATCNTNCFPGGTGGPDPNECHVIADAILFDSQNLGRFHAGLLLIANPANNVDPSGTLFNITQGTIIDMKFRSCESFFVNQASENLTYCRTDWSPVLDFVAFNCQSTQSAHGGNCVAADQRWFIQ